MQRTPPPPTEDEIRKSSRTNKGIPPKRLGDYQVNDNSTDTLDPNNHQTIGANNSQTNSPLNYPSDSDHDADKEQPPSIQSSSQLVDEVTTGQMQPPPNNKSSHLAEEFAGCQLQPALNSQGASRNFADQKHQKDNSNGQSFDGVVASQMQPASKYAQLQSVFDDSASQRQPPSYNMTSQLADGFATSRSQPALEYTMCQGSNGAAARHTESQMQPEFNSSQIQCYDGGNGEQMQPFNNRRFSNPAERFATNQSQTVMNNSTGQGFSGKVASHIRPLNQTPSPLVDLNTVVTSQTQPAGHNIMCQGRSRAIISQTYVSTTPNQTAQNVLGAQRQGLPNNAAYQGFTGDMLSHTQSLVKQTMQQQCRCVTINQGPTNHNFVHQEQLRLQSSFNEQYPTYPMQQQLVNTNSHAPAGYTQPPSHHTFTISQGTNCIQACPMQLPTNNQIQPSTTTVTSSQRQPMVGYEGVPNQPIINRAACGQPCCGTYCQNTMIQPQVNHYRSYAQPGVSNTEYTVQRNPTLTQQVLQSQPPNQCPNGQTMPFPTYAHQPLSTQTYATHSYRPKLHDLPVFNGLPEEWPMFIASFNESTTAFGYTQLENMLRLQKSLRNDAKRAVENILIHPRCVPAVIQELKAIFGRPERLIRSQLDKVRSWSIIPDNRLDLVMPFSMKVQNLCTLLESLGSQQHLANPMLLDVLISKLPLFKQLEWMQFSDKIKPYAGIPEFCGWLKEYAKYANILHLSQRTAVGSQPRNNRQDKNSIFHTKEGSNVAPTAISNAKVCILCSLSHYVVHCKEFKKLNVNERWNIVKKKQICFSCLMPGHVVSKCDKKRRCEKENCQRYHHHLLHETNKTDRENERTSEKISDSNFHANSPTKKKVLFKVLPVKLYGPRGEVSTFALLDDGSSVSILNDNIVTKLGLIGRKYSMSLNWIGQKEVSQPSSLVNLEISGIDDGSKRYELKNVRTYGNLSLPMQTMNLDHLPVGKEGNTLPINTYVNAVPQILIGLDNWRLIMGNSSVLCKPEGPIAVETSLGWVIYGSSDRNPDDSNYIFQITEDKTGDSSNPDDLAKLVNEYFMMDKVDPVPSLNIPESKDARRARKLLEDTTNRTGNRYETGLLWKADGIVLPDSLSMAKKRLCTVERAWKKDPLYAADYKAIIKNYVAKGYARKLMNAEIETKGPRTWYLPHFCVRNSHKGGKLRLVFDAAAKVGNISLNSNLLRGPEQCQDMVAILHKFREKPIAVCADISEMFHQITIRKEDQDSQRFLWPKEDDSGDVDTYVMEVMVFGATCSPCSAEYIKNLNAQRFAEYHPEAARVIIESHYVDDFVCSFTTKEEALSVTKDVIWIHKAGGFDLRKFSSNSSSLLEGLQKEHHDQSSIANMDIANHSEKVLGMHWIPAEDVFTFRLNFRQTKPELFNGEHYPTKREFLSIVMSIFDPFGLLADLNIHAKMMLQSLWKANITWEDEIPNEIQPRWLKWITTLDAVQQIRLPRCYSPSINDTAEVQLHILVDASEEAFAAAAYWRFTHQDDSVHLALIEGKSRCAPKKLLSVPRLELQAAVLGVRLRQRCLQSHSIRASKCIFWSDSRTVLAWINSDDPKKYKPFVGHRIAEILELSKQSEWRWIPTELNSADIATRSKKNLFNYQPGGKWVSGPEFLLEDESRWPMVPDGTNSISTPQEELRTVFRTTMNVFHVSSHEIDLTKFSKFLKLKRVMCWIIRVLTKIKNRPKSNILSASEMEYAEIVLCRFVQKQCYAKEYQTLKKEEQIHESSHIFKLSPSLDKDEVIRLSGRIDSAVCIPLQSRRPIILPKDNWLSKLIVKDVHETFHHQNHETILCEVRRKYWITNLRNLVKNIAKNCQECKNRQVEPKPPQMGQLPEDRLTPFVRPFTFTGVDYMGPVLVAIGRRREKRWIALFTCLTIRAVHLELATDLSTDGFILCLRNFVNRRGVPVRIRSDNGTNFVGADKEMKTCLDMFDQSAIENFLSGRGIQWKFNCPSNPSAGGCWERLVRSVKRVLYVILQDIVPKEDTLRSALIEAENIVNSRPLTHIPISHEEDEPLTPNHLILGCANSTQTPELQGNGPICLRKQWRIAQALKDRFWHRWINEYLPDLTRRTKWYKMEAPLAVGDLIIICESTMARSCWQRGRIIRVFPGRDGQVRSAEIQTATGILKRPVSKLAKMEVGESMETIHGGRDVKN